MTIRRHLLDHDRTFLNRLSARLRRRILLTHMEVLPDWAVSLGHGKPLILDAEPLLVHWNESNHILCQSLAALGMFPGNDFFGPKLVLTNSARRVPDSFIPEGWAYIQRGRKPWTRLPPPFRGAVVVGDQLLTDGLLAWRLGGYFFLVPLPLDAPVLAKVQRVLGNVVGSLFFSIDEPKHA